MWLKKIKFKKDYYRGDKLLFKEGTEINFKPITILVGENSSGKSSLLHLLIELDKEFIDVEKEDNTKFYFFDSEKMNPRVVDPEIYTSPDRTGSGYAVALASRFVSHGEIMQYIIINKLLEARDCILLFDEPEAGLDVKHQYIFRYLLDKAVERNVQTIVATHSIAIINRIEVFSLDNREWINSSDYLAKQIEKYTEDIDKLNSIIDKYDEYKESRKEKYDRKNRKYIR